MKQIEITGYGGPEVMRVGEAPTPKPGPGQVLIKTEAAGINPVDWKIREGYMRDAMPLNFPAVLGIELAGTVAAVGDGASGFAAGDPVLASTGFAGAFAEYVAVDADKVVRRPAGLDAVTAATLPVAVVTATVALDAGAVGQGTRVLVHAAAGGVGTILVQLAMRRGAAVTAVGSAGSMAYLRDLGLTDIVDRATAYENGPGGYDVVIDGAGPEAQARSWGLLKKGGILVTLTAPPSTETAEAHGVRAVMVYGGTNTAAVAEAAALVAAGTLKVRIEKTYPLAETSAALAESQRGGVRGKLVVTVG